MTGGEKGETAAERIERLKLDGLKPDGSWNNRVIRHPDGSLAIHEVHYSKDGTIKAWSADGREGVDPEDGLNGLIESVEFTYSSYLDAIAKPILDYGALPTSEPLR